MKTNPFARGIMKSRVILFLLAVVGMAVIGLNLGELVTARYGYTTALRPGNAQAPNVSLADAMASAR